MIGYIRVTKNSYNSQDLPISASFISNNIIVPCASQQSNVSNVIDNYLYNF